MLRFIVLGQVPGTSFQLSFAHISLLLTLFYAALYIYYLQHMTQNLEMATISPEAPIVKTSKKKPSSKKPKKTSTKKKTSAKKKPASKKKAPAKSTSKTKAPKAKTTAKKSKK